MSLPEVLTNGKTWEVLQGDCLEVLRTLPDASVDAVVTDPPYSSGGMFRGDRTLPTGDKYEHSGQPLHRSDFSGDNRDQRSWTSWCAAWMAECRRVTCPSGYLLAFTDWRQLPAISDAIQWAGWVWRGIIAWDKTGASRTPHNGYFRYQCEYIVWGTKGACRERPTLAEGGEGGLAGCYRFPVL